MRRSMPILLVMFALLAYAPAAAGANASARATPRESFEATGFDAFSSVCGTQTCTDTFVFAEQRRPPRASRHLRLRRPVHVQRRTGRGTGAGGCAENAGSDGRRRPVVDESSVDGIESAGATARRITVVGGARASRPDWDAPEPSRRKDGPHVHVRRQRRAPVRDWLDPFDAATMAADGRSSASEHSRAAERERVRHDRRLEPRPRRRPARRTSRDRRGRRLASRPYHAADACPTRRRPRAIPTAPILVVDDDAKIVRLVRTYLERDGFGS